MKRPKRRHWLAVLRLPPALFAALAIAVVAMSATGQPRPADPAPASPAAPAPAAPEGQKKDPTLFELFEKGGKVMWVLAASSVLAVAIIFERFFALRRNRIIPPGFVPGLKSICRDPREDRDRALDYCKANDSPMARMVAAFIKRLPMGFQAAEKALEDAGGNEALKLRSNMRMLYAIGSVATLLGLIGTIAGMIKAFMNTAKAGNADNKVELLSEGIYEAMVCTFGGLAVAIVVTIFYYYFVGRIEKLVGEINDELTAFSDEYGLNAESEAELTVTAGLERLR
jgi:biopolymer transport protein ExbB